MREPVPRLQENKRFVPVTFRSSRASFLVEPFITDGELGRRIVMHYSSAGNWPLVAAAGLVVAAGAWAFCTASSDCYWAAPTHKESPPSASTLGENKMSVMNANSQVHHANDANFRNLVLNSDVPVLVDFYADWCRPCQQLAPLLDELAVEIPGARIVKVNVDHSPNLAAAYGVSSIPSLKVFEKGEVTDQILGLASKKELRALLVD
jgi:thioredoxin 1